MDKILIIAAHPDDEVLGVGGTIAKYTSRGIEVSLLIVTDGSTAQYRDNPNLNNIIEEKKQETRQAADILGIKNIYYGGLPDMMLDTISHIEINKVIENIINEVKPTIVYTHFYGDINKDHQIVCESTLVACRPVKDQIVKKLFLYSVPSSTEWNIQMSHMAFMPNWYENIEEVYAKQKYRAMECYKKELREYPHPRNIKYLRNADTSEGNKVGRQVAESFMLVRYIVD